MQEDIRHVMKPDAEENQRTILIMGPNHFSIADLCLELAAKTRQEVMLVEDAIEFKEHRNGSVKIELPKMESFLLPELELNGSRLRISKHNNKRMPRDKSSKRKMQKRSRKENRK